MSYSGLPRCFVAFIYNVQGGEKSGGLWLLSLGGGPFAVKGLGRDSLSRGWTVSADARAIMLKK